MSKTHFTHTKPLSKIQICLSHAGGLRWQNLFLVIVQSAEDRFHCHATKKKLAVEEAKKMKCYKRLIYKQFFRSLLATVSELFAETFHAPL